MNDELELLAKEIGIPVADLRAAISSSGSLPEMERERYRRDGWAIFEPNPFNALYAFSDQDWLPSSFLAMKGDDVQISLIAARNPGHGAFSRLLKRLDECGLAVRVVAPLPQMAAILRKKGWVAEHVGSTFDDRMDIWRPAPKAEEGARQEETEVIE